ncbi:MAG: nucleotidyltransferase domain-containing protein [Saprospiraceae bacterium]
MLEIKEQCKMEAIQKRYQEASKIYVEQEKLNQAVIGIIISGSLLYSTIDKNSDIDIHVILDPNCEYRERGNTWINGIEVEYLKNPPAQIRRYFEKEKKSPHTAHMLAHGQIAYSRSRIIEELVVTAKAIIKTVPPKLKAFEIEFEKYFLDDYYKDFEDALLNKNSIGISIIRNKIINRSIDIFCKTHQIRRGKDKRLSQQIELLDPAYCQKIELAVHEKWNQITALAELRIATEELLGGRRSLEWKLKSNLDL